MAYKVEDVIRPLLKGVRHDIGFPISFKGERGERKDDAFLEGRFVMSALRSTHTKQGGSVASPYMKRQ